LFIGLFRFAGRIFLRHPIWMDEKVGSLSLPPESVRYSNLMVLVTDQRW